VKITKFRDVTTATTIQHSSLSILFQARELISNHGTDDAIERAQVGIAMKKKMKVVIAWAQHTQSTFLSYLDAMREYNKRPHGADANQPPYKNWICSEKKKLRHCSSIAEVVFLKELCLVRFFAKIGEICLQHNARKSDTIIPVENWIFVSKIFLGQTDVNLAKAFICKGCKNCGCPMEEENGSASDVNQMALPLYCENNANHIHCIGWIYRPFLVSAWNLSPFNCFNLCFKCASNCILSFSCMTLFMQQLHVWDQSANIPVLVKNPTAQLLLGNIQAESVFQSLEAFHFPNIDKITEAAASDTNTSPDREDSHHYSRNMAGFKRDDESITTRDLYLEDIQASKRVHQGLEGNQSANMIDFANIFLILLRTLLRKDENSPFEFQILVHPDASKETRSCLFELVSFKMLGED
ncbi:hypothetical protein KI387_015980, partial [Taxus chinensis]